MPTQPTRLAVWLCVLVAFGAHPSAGTARAARDSTPKPAAARQLFEFHSDFWVNLHHFLYITARARQGLDVTRASTTRALADTEGFSKLTSSEQTEWQTAVAYYESKLARRDLIFDRDMVAIGNQLDHVASAAQLRKKQLDPMLVTTLEHAAPVYRRLWWPRHDAANKAWLKAVTPKLDLYGDDLAEQEIRVFREPWAPTPVRVDVVAYANWGGAYTTNYPSHIVVSSGDAGNQDDQALEVLFHEALHTLDDTLLSALRAAFRARGKPLPHDPTHVFIFYTAGALTHRALPDHVPYAEKYGLWERVPDFKRALPVLQQYWQPYLDGKSTFDEAVARYAAGAVRVNQLQGTLPAIDPRCTLSSQRTMGLGTLLHGLSSPS